LVITSYTVGAFEENCYLVVDEDAGRAALVDPGAEGERLVDAVRESGAQLDAIWLTHAHVDHVGGIAAVRRVWDVPIYLHPADEILYRNAARQAAAYGLPFDDPPAADRQLADGDTVRVGTLAFEVMHTPGHAPGLVVFHGHGVAFAGDLIFAGSIGRTDLPLSNPAHMQLSLARAATLPPETVLYPGHGPATTMAAELRSNPFLAGTARVLRR
jgi:glyoxylase-like metal-dependent hydrolase (beta-lactamase superfamily II)